MEGGLLLRYDAIIVEADDIGDDVTTDAIMDNSWQRRPGTSGASKTAGTGSACAVDLEFDAIGLLFMVARRAEVGS